MKTCRDCDFCHTVRYQLEPEYFEYPSKLVATVGGREVWIRPPISLDDPACGEHKTKESQS